MVVTSARAIENRMLYNLHGVAVLAFSPREDLLGTPWEAIVAFDRSGAMVGGNTAARSLLGMRGMPRGTRFEDLFEATIEEALRNRCDRAWTLQSVSGVRMVARQREPAEAARVVSAAPVSRRSERANGTTKRDGTLAFLQLATNDNATAEAFARARCAYDRNVPALIVGETGTGKELVARALHYLGSRAEGPFIAVNCAALPESLVEAELFGYVDGAFTGARRGGAQGRIELAHGGTLFLDEIGDMPLASQAKLLRVLQERCIVRLGDNRERPLDVALVCATHQDLPQLIAAKAFREDLYYRTNGLCVTLPPLRKRTNILELAHHVLAEQAPGHDFSEQAVELLLSHPWPGNLRQLSHVVASAAALVGEGHRIEPVHFPEDFLRQAQVDAPPGAARADEGSRELVSLDQAEADLIERTIRACNGNVSAAARALRVSRSTLYNKLKR
jgi:transcriptional regulator with PAS, ATPase and Fis domain